MIDTEAGKVVATVPVAAGPHGMAITQDGRTVYVSGDGSSSVDVIDTATDKVVKTINVGKAPNGMALTPDDRLLVVTVYGEDRHRLHRYLDANRGCHHGGAQTAYCRDQPQRQARVRHGAGTGSLRSRPHRPGYAELVRTLDLDKTPRDGEFGYDGKLFYFTQAGVSSVQVLDPASDRIVAEIPTGVSPHFVSYPRGSAFGIVVVQGPSELLLFDPATNKPARSIAVGKQPHWATASGDGKKAYVTNEGSNDFTVVDLATGQTTTIPSATRHARSSSSEPRRAPGRECRMTTYHKQISKQFVEAVAMVGGLLISCIRARCLYTNSAVGIRRPGGPGEGWRQGLDR